MHWVINTSLKRELGYDALIYNLERQRVEYTLCRKPPFVDYLISMEDDLDENGCHKEIHLDIDGHVFVSGTTSMKGVSDKHGWKPGYIDSPSIIEGIEHWGDNCLQYGCMIGTIKDIVPPEGKDFFIKPNEDSKSFSGTLMDSDKFESFRDNLLKIDSYTTIPPETEVIISPIKKIWAEYRTIIVGGRYVTGSRYKTGSRVEYSPDVGGRIIDFANEMIDIWNPRVAVTLDIADTPEGLKIIETNSISSSGFYAIDMSKFVGEISSL